MPWYRTEGKLENPMSEADFIDGMEHGHFINQQHKAYCVLLYHTGIRRSEGTALKRENFRLIPKFLLVDVGERKKHSKKTPPLPLPLDAPYVPLLEDVALATKQGKNVFRFCDRTGYNIVRRVFKYPHYFRLSRITYFFMPHPEVGRPQGFSIAEVRSWTGLSLKALDYYVGLVGIQKMGEALAVHGTNTA